MLRAARYDGWFPIGLDGPGHLAEGVAAIAAERDVAGRRGPFDGVVDGAPKDDPEPWRDAGATWWLTSFTLQGRLDEVRAAIAAGPPASTL